MDKRCISLAFRVESTLKITVPDRGLTLKTIKTGYRMRFQKLLKEQFSKAVGLPVALNCSPMKLISLLSSYVLVI